MPVRMLNFLKEPPAPRWIKGKETPIHKTQEWQDVILALGAGLKPQEYIAIEFPADAEVRKRMKHPTVALVRNLKLKIKELGLPYDCYQQGELVLIVGRGVLA